MANEGLSPEQIQKLARIISEAKDLTSQQEEIIKRVLDGETEIGKTRISYLNQYFDNYSKNLDKIIARKTSDLNDTFLILDKKLDSSYRKLSSDIDGLTKKLANMGDVHIGTKSDTPENKGNQERAAEPTTKPAAGEKTAAGYNGQLETIIKLLSEKAGAASNYSSNLITSELAAAMESGRGSARQYIPDTDQGPTVSATNTIPESARNQLDSVDVQGHPDVNNMSSGEKLSLPDVVIFEKLEQLRQLNKEAQAEITAAWKSGDEEQIKSVEKKYEEQAILFEEQLQLQAGLTEKYQQALLDKEEALDNKLIELEFAKNQSAEQQAIRLTEVRLRELDKVLAAELEAQNFMNRLSTEIAYANTPEAGEFRAREVNAQEELKSAQELAKLKAEYIAKEELKAKRANNGKLDKEDAARIQKEANSKFKANKENLDKLTKLRQTQEAKDQKAKEKALEEEEKKRKKAGDTAIHAAMSGPLNKENNLLQRFKDLKELTKDEDGNKIEGAGLAVALKAISDLATQLNDTIDKIALYKGDIDTRLQGSKNDTFAGSYWDQLTKDMMSVGAVTPFFKQEKFAENIKSLVDRGIAFDLKQRAFLMTIQEKIANTFNVADGTLLRLVRIQQEDSTAGRLGMEAALNSFLNEMYENTEYLKTVADVVRGSLQEMEALMGGAEATEVEYQVQKWMGSLYSVGMSQDAVQGIASALGQLAAGQIDALTGNNSAGNLLVMAANEAGIAISDILSEGLNADETNKLLQATVNYLAEIAESSKGNNVVQQQLAGVFGVKASDLKAATNLKSFTANGTTKDYTQSIFDESLNYSSMINKLLDMAGSMGSRTSIGEMMSNVWANGKYSIAGSIASTPIAYLTYKMASLLDSTVGGIAIPAISVFGNMVDLETTVADLMRVGAVGTGILGSLGSMISGLSSSFSGRSMLSKMGIESASGLQVVERGRGDNAQIKTPPGNNGVGATAAQSYGGAQTTSGSGYVGNASGSDIKDSTIQEAEDTKEQLMIEAQENTEATQIDFINTNVLKIYELLDDVANGKRSLNVKVSGYGLTSLGGSSASSAQGGLGGLLSDSAASGDNGLSGGFNVGGGAGSSSNGSYSGLSGSIDLGGWKMR